MSHGRVADTATSPASVEVVDVDAEFSTLSEIEIQDMKIVSESPWHLWQAGILTLIHARGERMLALYDASVVVVRGIWKMGSEK